MLTLRQLQKLLSASNKDPNALIGNGLGDVALLGNTRGVFKRQQFGRAALKNGFVVNTCSCGCTINPVGCVTSFVDSLCRKYGPNVLFRDAVAAEQRAQPNNDGAAQPSGGGQSGGGAAQGTSSSASSAADGYKADAASDEWRAQEAAAAAARQAAQAEAAKQAQKQAAEAKAQAEALAAAKRAARKKATGLAAANAKRVLKRARRQASFKAPVESCGPSLQSRRSLASANGRLRAVPANLRTRMAELLNRLMGSTGTSGGSVSPIPVYDSRKLVKRLLVRRPLPNALKEDVITGRPVTLFLPDVSPSCARQAQAACDIANAAGYAGVSGSDVLVLPHSNGCVDEYEDSYMPWFNGKPVSLKQSDWSRLFTEITAGQSRYKIRVVIAVGDHDAEEMYRELSALKSVKRFVWLHNATPGSPGPRVDRSEPDGWSVDCRKKTQLVWGCNTQNQMLRGLDLVLRQ